MRLGLVVRRFRTALVLALLAASGLLVATSAQADTDPLAGAPSTVSADRLPTAQINGVVWDQAVVGNTVFAGGKFTKARPPGVSAGGAGEAAAGNFVAYDIRTGNRLGSAFTHSFNGQVMAVAGSPDGSRVYLGGDFTSVDGSARGHIAAIDAATGALVQDFHPSVNGQVRALAVSPSTVYAGGSFGKVGSSTRTRLAAFNPADGALTSWAASADNGQVQGMAVTPDGSRVVAGGRFTTLNHVAANGMGALSTATGATQQWLANQTIRNGGSACGITSITADDKLVYGSGFAFGCGNFEGTFAANPTTGAIVVVNDCHGDTYDTFPSGLVLYSVSHAHDCKPIGALPTSQPWAINMRHALAFTTFPTCVSTGPDVYGWNYKGLPCSGMLQWFPELKNGSFTGQTQAAWSVSGNDDYIVLGGEFPKVNGTNQQGLVRFARRDLAPNKVGPVRSPEPPAPTAAGVNASSIKVTWQTAYDMDNQNLIYDVYRSGTAQPVYSTTRASNYWNYPTQTFTDTGVPGGTYSYTVKVSDPLGNTLTLPATNSVSMAGGGNAAPIAAFATTTLGLTAHFDASASVDPDGTIVEYSWDFGDATGPGSGDSPSHPYASNGTYAVVLTVTDNRGASRSIAHQVTVADNAGGGTPGQVAADTFERTATGGWGAAETGGPWTVSGTKSNYKVGNGVGTMTVPSAGTTRTATLGSVATADTDLQVTLSPQQMATGGGNYLTLIGRQVGSTSYRSSLVLKSDGTATLGISKIGGGEVRISPRVKVPGFSFGAADRINMRFEMIGTSPTTLRAKVWKAETAEPVAWTVTGTDSTAALQASGAVGIATYLSGSTTNAPAAVTFDDLSVNGN